MNIYIKQHVFSWKDRFTVKDGSGRDRYFVEGELFSWGKKLHVYDTKGTEVIYIQEKVLSWLPKYYVFVEGRQVAEIAKELSLFKPRYRVDGLGWTVTGDFLAHEYSVFKGEIPIVTISKQWFTWGDCYDLNIANSENELPALAVVLAIDCAMAAEQAASS